MVVAEQCRMLAIGTSLRTLQFISPLDDENGTEQVLCRATPVSVSLRPQYAVKVSKRTQSCKESRGRIVSPGLNLSRPIAPSVTTEQDPRCPTHHRERLGRMRNSYGTHLYRPHSSVDQG